MILAPLRPRYAASGIIVATVLLAGFVFAGFVAEYGAVGALDVDGGGGAVIGILLLVNAFGLGIGLPISTVIYRLAPRSRLAAVIGIAIFSSISGWFNSSPVLNEVNWWQGTLYSAIFAAISIIIGLQFQRLAENR